ncbi:sigma-70 family RNA polymerase sigma factor [Brevibacillus ruminantium]|uniref:Sigma-70 family RNA polymerase sigma factor n=1 Tax=Brevibacillus ruminantium TaxID=2950604 RepID=A0ABY4WPD3_9BACL|nr:sigma-70 family RNA polymerase sigma factor [Brevibacillus ruminantium]USG68519.1 sigma-70 family RNA polymerase sigma factor [Brevibacillus ruminantium]
MKEIEWLAKSRNGDSASFEQLVRPHLETAYRTAYLIIHDRQLAQDAVQEALFEVFRSLDRFDPARGTSFRTWFAKIVMHRALNAVRRQKPMGEFQEWADMSANPLDSVIEREQQQAIWKAICSMKVKHRTVVILYYYGDFQVSEIAQVLGLFEGTVKSRLHYARKQIAAQMQGWVEGRAMSRMGVSGNE